MNTLELIECLSTRNGRVVEPRHIALARNQLAQMLAYIANDVRNCSRCLNTGVERYACTVSDGQIVETPIPCQGCEHARRLFEVPER